MPSGTKVSLIALLGAVLLGWLLVASSPERRPAASAPLTTPEREPVPVPSPAKPAPLAAAPAAPPAAPAARPTAAPVAPAVPLAPVLEDPERGRTESEVDPVAESYAARQEQIDRNAARYDDAHGRFSDEARDPEWATAQEVALQSMANETGTADIVESVECKSTLCQMRIRSDSLTPGGIAIRIGGLARDLGKDRVLRMEGAPGDRTMVIYTPRDGKWPDTPSEDPTLDGK